MEAVYVLRGSFIVNGTRNKLEPERSKKLVFVHYNKELFANSSESTSLGRLSGTMVRRRYMRP